MKKLTIGMYVFWILFAVLVASRVRAGEIYVYAGQFEYPSTDSCVKETIASANNPREYVTCTTSGGKAFAHVPMPSDMDSTERFTEIYYNHTTTAVAAVGNVGYKFCFVMPRDGETVALSSIPANSCSLTANGAMPAQNINATIPNLIGMAPTNVAGADCDTGSNKCKERIGVLVLERDEGVASNSVSDDSINWVRLIYP